MVIRDVLDGSWRYRRNFNFVDGVITWNEIVKKSIFGIGYSFFLCILEFVRF